MGSHDMNPDPEPTKIKSVVHPESALNYCIVSEDIHFFYDETISRPTMIGIRSITLDPDFLLLSHTCLGSVINRDMDPVPIPICT